MAPETLDENGLVAWLRTLDPQSRIGDDAAFLPAGRDIVSYGTAILPGEAETRPLMTAADPSARAMTWGMWGLNHCFITALKLLAIKAKDKAMLKMLTVLTAVYVPLLLVGQKEMGPLGGDVGGFVAICAVQTLTLGYLAK